MRAVLDRTHEGAGARKRERSRMADVGSADPARASLPSCLSAVLADAQWLRGMGEFFGKAFGLSDYFCCCFFLFF